MLQTLLNNEIDLSSFFTMLGLKMCTRVEYISKGVVNVFVLALKFSNSILYFFSKLGGSTNEKNGKRSSSLPCTVFLISAKLINQTLNNKTCKKNRNNKPMSMICHEDQNRIT